MTLQDVLKFIKTNKLAVVSTIDAEGKPQSAVVEFGELDDLTIVVDTLKTSRKYKNLQNSPHTAIVIGWDDCITVQMSAVAHELKGDELELAKAAHFAKKGSAHKHELSSDLAYFAFKPTWIRYADFKSDPWIIQEFKL